MSEQKRGNTLAGNAANDENSGSGDGPTPSVAPTDSPTPEKLRRADLACARVLPRLRAQPDATLIPVNFDIPSLMPKLLKASARAQAHRHVFLQVHPFDMTQVDEFDDYVLALAHTHSVVRISEETIDDEDVPYLMERRAELYGDAQRAVSRGLMDKAKLANITLNNNHTELAYDAMALAQLFLLSWDTLQGRTGATREELEAVRDKANSLILMTPSKDEKPTSLIDATLDRRRAATKVLRTHRKMRIALALFYETQEEVDAILPPLQMRTRTKSKAKRPKEEDVVDDELNDEIEDTGDSAEEDSRVEAEPVVAVTPRASVFTTKGNTPTKVAVGAGLPGSSPVDEE